MTVIDFSQFTENQVKHIIEVSERRDDIDIEYFDALIEGEEFEVKSGDLNSIVLGLNNMISEGQDEEEIVDCIESLKDLQGTQDLYGN